MPHYPRIVSLLSFLCIILTNFAHASDYNIQISMSGTQKIVAEAVYPVPLEAVWKVINAPQEFPKFQPRILSVAFLGLSKGSERYFVKIQTPGWLPNMWNIISATSFKDTSKVTWKKMEGNLVEHEGFVQLKPDRESVKLHLEMTVQGLGLIPTRAVHWAVKSNVSRFLKLLGDELVSQKSLQPKVIEIPLKR